MLIISVKLKLKSIFQIVLFLPISLYLCLYYLPFRQAIKIPILVYRPKLLKIGGRVRIHGHVKFGMIKLGFPTVSLYPNSGIIWENKGTIIFKGKCNIGNASALSIGEKGVLEFGNNFRATTAFKAVCYASIKYEESVLIGWDNLFCDTDFHATYCNDVKSKGFSPIEIGAGTWFALGCVTLKSTRVPKNSVIGAKSLLMQDYAKDSMVDKLFIAGNPGKVLKQGVSRKSGDDNIIYS